MNKKAIPCPDCEGHGYINGGCETAIWSRTCDRCHGTGYTLVPKTMSDKIREMNDEELSSFVYDLTGSGIYCTNKKECLSKIDTDEITDEMCKKCLLEWLQKPVEEPKLPTIFEDKQESGLLEE